MNSVKSLFFIFLFCILSNQAFALKWKLICDINDYRAAKTNFNVRNFFPERQEYIFDNNKLTVTQRIFNNTITNKIYSGEYRNEFINNNAPQKGIHWDTKVIKNNEELIYTHFFFGKTGQFQIGVKSSKRIIGPIFGKCGTQKISETQENIQSCKGTNINKWTNCYSEYKANLGIYKGTFLNGMVHGRGVFEYFDGGIYEGDFFENKMHGNGKMIYPNGTTYTGGFINDKFGSKGKMILENKNTYEGEFVDGYFDGFGTFNWTSGNRYVGSFKKGSRTGDGKIFFKNGAKYFGSFKNGKFDGYGTYTWADGTTYKGEHRNGKGNGFGTYEWSLSSKFPGDKYIGNLKDDKFHGFGKLIHGNGKIEEGIWESGKFVKETKNNSVNVANQSKTDKKNKDTFANEVGSGFYVSKFGHIVTNQHVVNQCKKITVGNSINTQIPVDLIASDVRNDLAILQTVSLEMASIETKSFIQKLRMEIGPIVSSGLLRSEDVSGGEEIFVAGYPLGNMVSDQMKLTDGIVSATKGLDNDTSKFEISSVVRKGNSGGPIYDTNGNIIGVVVERFNLNKTDNVNFAIKASIVKQFLSANNVSTKWSEKTGSISTKDIYQLASKQTVMVVCHRN